MLTNRIEGPHEKILCPNTFIRDFNKSPEFLDFHTAQSYMGDHNPSNNRFFEHV
jgi:hypothetical protein